MHSTDSNFPGNGDWRKLYQVAILELDCKKLPYRIADAEYAIHQRLTELLTDAGDHVEEEEALNDAAYALRALRSTAKAPTTTANSSDSRFQKLG